MNTRHIIRPCKICLLLSIFFIIELEITFIPSDLRGLHEEERSTTSKSELSTLSSIQKILQMYGTILLFIGARYNIYVKLQSWPQAYTFELLNILRVMLSFPLAILVSKLLKTSHKFIQLHHLQMCNAISKLTPSYLCLWLFHPKVLSVWYL